MYKDCFYLYFWGMMNPQNHEVLHVKCPVCWQVAELNKDKASELKDTERIDLGCCGLLGVSDSNTVKKNLK